VAEALVARESKGKIHFGPSEGDQASLAFRRSLYVSSDVKAGDLASLKNVRAVRPGFGLAIKHFPDILGMSFTKDAPAGTPLEFNLLK
jgi:N-acetylneuraminate synthase